jgi:hypothetical protein
MSFEIRRDREVIRIVLSGTFTNQDLLHGGMELAKLEEASPSLPNRILDVRPVERIEIDFAGMFALAESRRRKQYGNAFKTAILADGLVHYGFARMFQTLNDHPQIAIAIFGNDEDALAWLMLPDHSPPEVPWQPRSDRSADGGG